MSTDNDIHIIYLMADISLKHIAKRTYIHHPTTRMETNYVQFKENTSVLLIVLTQAVNQ